MPSLLKFGALAVAWSALLAASQPGVAQTSLSESSSGFERNSDRDIFNTIQGESDKGSVLDATNPMDLINRIRQSGAMDDATPPSDAIDAALKSFQQEPAGSSKP